MKTEDYLRESENLLTAIAGGEIDAFVIGKDDNRRVLLLANAYQRYRQQPLAFFKEVLNWEPWEKQREITLALLAKKRVAVATCNGSGKSSLAGRIVAWFLSTRKDSIVVTTSATSAQLAGSRAERVKVRALNVQGEPFTIETEGLLAVCIQHEIDHLDGKVFVEYLSRLKQSRIAAKLKKQERAAM